MKRTTSPLIIGFSGPKGSGKTTIARYLSRRYGIPIISFGDILNECLSTIGAERTRANQITLSLMLRDTFGSAILTKAIEAKIKKSNCETVLIESIRMPGDWQYWKKQGYQNILIGVTAEADERYRRIVDRGKTIEEKQLRRAQFNKEELLPTEQATLRLAKRANYELDGNQSLSRVKKDADAIMKSLHLYPKKLIANN